MNAQRQKFSKDPDAVLDYKVDWSAWLPEGDTIAATEWTADDGIVIDSNTFTDTSATVWLSGGGAEGEVYNVVNHIITAFGREEDQTIMIQIRSR